jgi:hypothetical protein
MQPSYFRLVTWTLKWRQPGSSETSSKQFTTTRCYHVGMVKVKLSLCLTKHHHEGVLGEWRYNSTNSLTSALDGGEWSSLRPGSFTPWERAPGTHCIGGWVGPRAVLDAVVKRKFPSSHRESNPRTRIVQPVARRYAD